MRKVIAFVGVALFFLPGVGRPGPVEGPRGTDVKLPAGAPGRLQHEMMFEGGKRACVVIKGDHDPVCDLAIKVYDKEGNLVAEDTGSGDLAAVIWYPPRDDVYRIVFENPQNVWNKCWIAFN